MMVKNLNFIPLNYGKCFNNTIGNKKNLGLKFFVIHQRKMIHERNRL